MATKSKLPNGGRLPPRDPKGGRPSRRVARQLGPHILEVAFEKLVEHGAEGTTMAHIAEAARVSKRTLYSRFGSKAELVVAAVENRITNDLRLVVDGMSSGSGRERILHVARRMLDRSLTREAIGLEALLIWIRDHRLGSRKHGLESAADAGVGVIESLLADMRDLAFMSPEKRRLLAVFMFDSLVLMPRHHILVHRDLEDTPDAKNAVLERNLDFIACSIPSLENP